MAQALLKRRLNPLLLISVVAALSLLAGVSVIYQDQLNDKITEIDNLEEEKLNLNKSLNQTEWKLSLKESELQDTTLELGSVKDNLSDVKEERENLSDRLGDRKVEIDNLEEEVRELESNLSDFEGVKAEVDALNASLGEICGELDPENATDAEDECEEWGYEAGG
ncbi:MAG: hypothetical protein V5A72_01260 [Candidatus Nanohaloarchaea archaeon]